jgi:phage gp46-like protein
MDAKAKKNINGSFTLSITNGDLTSEEGFDTAIFMSLFTDARATEQQIATPENRRGWLGDTVSPVKDRSLGSLLYLVNQKRLTQDTLNKTVNFTKLALNWMITDGLAKSITVTGELVPRSGIGLNIKIKTKLGPEINRYIKLWEVTGNAT